MKRKIKQLNWKRNLITKKIKYFIFMKFLSFIFFFVKRRNEIINLDSVKKVLIIRNDCIGDMIVTTPFIRCLSNAGYKVYISSRKSSLDILDGNPYISDCFLYQDRKLNNLVDSIRTIRKHQFDLSIDARFHRRLDLKHLIFCCLIKTNSLLSYNKSNIKAFNISLPYYKPNDHVTNQLKYYLDNLNIKYDLFNYDIYINPSQNQNVTDFINRYIYPNKFVVINPFGSSEYRCLSGSQLQGICDLFKKHYQDYKIVLIGEGKKFEKLSLLDTIKFKSETIMDVTPLIKRADLVISIDTSIVHIASAFSTKCISIYMEPLAPNLVNLKSIYSREYSDYKYLRQDLFLDGKYIKKYKPRLEFQINKDLWAPNNINGRQLVFDANSIESVEVQKILESIKKYI